MKKQAFTLLLISSIFIFSCHNKKYDPTPSEDPTTPITSTDTVGILQIATLKSADSFPPFGDTTMVGAIFYDEKKNLQPVNSVSLNGINLDYNSTDTTYESDAIKDFSKFNWSIKGKGNIPDFDYNNTAPTPEYTGFALLPDSIDRSKNLTISLTGIKNATNLFVYIYTNNSNADEPGLLDANVKSVTFSAAELSQLETGYGFIAVGVYNFNPQVFGGKKFIFSNEVSTYKTITVY